MHSKEVLNDVIELLLPVTDAEEITEESEIIEDLGVSSMDILFLLSSLEAKFSIKISEKQIRKVVTVGDLVDLVAESMK